MSQAALIQASPSQENYNVVDLMLTFPSKTFKKGDYILREGQLPKHIYYIQSGKALSLVNYPAQEKTLSNGFFVQEQFINLNSLTNSHQETSSIKALSKVEVRQIPISVFNSLMRQHPFLHQMVLHALVRQVEKKSQYCHQTVLFNSNQRIVQFLLDYVAEAGSRVGYEWVVRDFLTQAQIALLSNTGRQTVSTLLNDLRRQNIIHFTRKYMLVRDLDLLKAYLISEGNV